MQSHIMKYIEQVEFVLLFICKMKQKVQNKAQQLFKHLRLNILNHGYLLFKSIQDAINHNKNYIILWQALLHTTHNLCHLVRCVFPNYTRERTHHNIISDQHLYSASQICTNSLNYYFFQLFTFKNIRQHSDTIFLIINQ